MRRPFDSAQFIIRPMKLSDIPSVTAIEKQAHIAPWTEGIFKDCYKVGCYCKVLDLNHEIIGFIIAQIAIDECHLLNICIDPLNQGKGYGEQLLQTLLSDSTKQQVNKIYLEVRASNVKAQRLYKKYNFYKIGRRKNYYKDSNEEKEDAITFALDIASTK